MSVQSYKAGIIKAGNNQGWPRNKTAQQIINQGVGNSVGSRETLGKRKQLHRRKPGGEQLNKYPLARGEASPIREAETVAAAIVFKSNPAMRISLW